MRATTRQSAAVTAHPPELDVLRMEMEQFYCQKIRNSKSGLSDLVEGIR